MSKPVVAIVGRPNVGKSTLFNRIVGGMIAIVENTPGVTRDRLYFDAEWQGRKFTLIDTGGIEFKDQTTPLSSMMKQQAEVAVDEADVILFMVDGKSGLTPDDQQIARYLRKSNKPVLLVANKVEKFNQFETEAHEFLALGFGDPVPVSAVHGMNTGDLLDTMVSMLPDDPVQDYDPDVVKVAVIGRPNVGKSSIVNMLLGEQRVIVSDIPGTTRDAIDTPFTYEDRNYVLIDTAGIRRKKKIMEVTENYSVVRSFRAVDRSDVVLMVIDAVEGVAEQDKKIVGYAHEAGKGLILIINKWDLVTKDEKTINKYEKDIREELSFISYAPTQFVSAKTGQRINKIMDLVEFVAEQTSRRVSTSTLNTQLREWVHLNPPPSDKGVRLKILYATQSSVQPPTFIFFVNDPELVHFSYKRYLENQLRKNFGFEGSPIRLVMRKRDEEQD
ncbi:ribosome biogenesis GTPase Der [Dehalobacter sp. DCM]|uniref:ribosome biogenesis GTPase Der n=1 Tax=Dehalobacter sp. DCM TaxID=2907827 RepID=UPI003081B32E|nr:ribosome biogenesis GTPase Der [Dehalobacter sp. DCM]